MRLSTGSPAVVASAILCSCEMRADLTCLIVSSAVPRIALSAGVPSLRPYAMNTAVVARGMVHPVTLSSATSTQLRNGSSGSHCSSMCCTESSAWEPLVRVPVLQGADHDALQQPPFGFFRVDDRNYLSNIQLVLPFCNNSSVDIRHCGARAAC